MLLNFNRNTSSTARFPPWWWPAKLNTLRFDRTTIYHQHSSVSATGFHPHNTSPAWTRSTGTSISNWPPWLLTRELIIIPHTTPTPMWNLTKARYWRINQQHETKLNELLLVCSGMCFALGLVTWPQFAVNDYSLIKLPAFLLKKMWQLGIVFLVTLPPTITESVNCPSECRTHSGGDNLC